MEHFLNNQTAEAFNDKYPVGTRFKYFSVLGIPDSVEVTTRTTAWALGHGDVVVSLTGRAGGFHIKHMKFVALPEKELPRLTVFDIESLKALCVRVNSLYSLNGDHPDGIEISGLKSNTDSLETWLTTITPTLVMRLLSEIRSDKEAPHV